VLKTFATFIAIRPVVKFTVPAPLAGVLAEFNHWDQLNINTGV